MSLLVLSNKEVEMVSGSLGLDALGYGSGLLLLAGLVGVGFFIGGVPVAVGVVVGAVGGAIGGAIAGKGCAHEALFQNSGDICECGHSIIKYAIAGGIAGGLTVFNPLIVPVVAAWLAHQHLHQA